MKYQKEIDQLLRDMFYEDWMDEEDYLEIEIEILKQTGVSKALLSKQIEIGVDNGYTIDKQIQIIKTILNK